MRVTTAFNKMLGVLGAWVADVAYICCGGITIELRTDRTRNDP